MPYRSECNRKALFMVDHSQQWGCHCKHRKERMERTGWKARLYMKCFCLLLAIAIWRVIFVLRYSFMGVSQEQIVVSNSHSQETSESPLIHASQKRESLRSSISLTPTKLSTFQLDLDVALLHPFWPALSTINNKSDPCAGKYVYMYELPSQFNQKMLEECNQLSPWTDMCKFTANAGLGPRLEDSEGVFSKIGWFATNQFALDVIFHNRMKQYECLTQDSRKAAVLYVPFYAGLDISRHLWNASASVRDFASLSLANWLQSRPEWKVMGGQDHFLVGGRITWDFRRLTEDDQDWGNKLLQIPAILNMTMLVVEASPWHNNDFGIPYPTYFHPTQDSDVLDWQNRMRTANRSSLFSFAGAPRPEISTSIRSQIMNQCKQSSFCKLLECDKGESKCHSPNTVMKLFQESVFCLQPQGDSFTRRSIFDSMVAGCIPVFFHTDSAYSQYIWHLPQNQSQYSIFIPEDDIRKKNVSLESILLQIPSDTVKSMRDEVISLIPGLVYADPRYRLETLKDAFDITVKALIDKVTDLRVHIMEGRELEMSGGNKKDLYVKSSIEGSEQATRRWEGKRRNGEHEWIERDSSHPLQNGQILKENVKKRPITTSLED